MFLDELQRACAEEWEYITGASLTAIVSLAVCTELWDRSTTIPKRFSSSTTVWNRTNRIILPPFGKKIVHTSKQEIHNQLLQQIWLKKSTIFWQAFWSTRFCLQISTQQPDRRKVHQLSPGIACNFKGVNKTVRFVHCFLCERCWKMREKPCKNVVDKFCLRQNL